jgi:uncharacterized protein YgiM (DUF1202 family)
MRITGPCLFALAALFAAAPAAAERAAVIRAGDLKAKPAIDASTVASLAANQSVNVLGRQVGWVQVETGGKNGWVRMLNLRMEAATGTAKPAPRRAGASPASLFTGSSGKTVTTGIKGMDEEDIRNATPNMAEVAVLASLAVQPAEASANAQKNGLKEHKVEHLKEGSRK